MKVVLSRFAVKTGIDRINVMINNGIKRNKFELPVDTFLAQVPKQQQKAAKAMLGNADRVICSAKANNDGNGFSVLGFIAKEGDKSVGKGAVSVSHFGTPEAVAKWRFDSKNLQTNGFFRKNKQLSFFNQTSKGLSIDGKMQLNYCNPKLAEANVNVKPEKVLDLKNLFDSLIHKFGLERFKFDYLNGEYGPFHVIAGKR